MTNQSHTPAEPLDATNNHAVEILPPLADAEEWTCTADDITLPQELEFETVERIGGRNAVTPMKQRVFIRVLVETGRVALAAKAAGNVPGSFYYLRNHPDGKSFAAAWARALDFGTGRVLDILLDHAINGTPEYFYKDGVLAGERRLFNHKMMMWLVAHNMPEKFGVQGGLMFGSSGGAAGAARMKRLKKEWQQEWYAEIQAKRRDPDEIRESILKRFDAIDRPKMIAIARDPAKRAAWELLNGTEDWSKFERG